MSLKSKIMLGFVSICVIFIAIGAVLGLLLNNVKKETERLNAVVLPSNDASSELKFNVANESFLITDYISTKLDDDWKSAMEVRADTVKLIGSLGAQVADLAAKYPDLGQTFKTFSDNYQKYQEATTPVPDLLKTDTETWKGLVDTYAIFKDNFRQYGDVMVARAMSSAKSQAAPDTLAHQFQMVGQVLVIERQIQDVFTSLFQCRYQAFVDFAREFQGPVGVTRVVVEKDNLLVSLSFLEDKAPGAVKSEALCRGTEIALVHTLEPRDGMATAAR